MERDDEVKGGGNSYDFGARIYDSRLGRWLARDGMEAKYPAHSTYSFAIDNPIFYLDPDGNEKVTHYTIISDKGVTTVTVVDDEYAVEAVSARQYESSDNMTFHNIERSVNLDIRSNIDSDENQTHFGEYEAGEEISTWNYLNQKLRGIPSAMENEGDYKGRVKGGFHFYTTDGFGQGQEMTEAELAEFVDGTELFARLVNFKPGYYDSPSGLQTPSNKLMDEVEIIGFFEYAARYMKSHEFLTFDLVALEEKYDAWVKEERESNLPKSDETTGSGVLDTVIETTNFHLYDVSRQDTTILDENGDTVSTTKLERR